MNILAWFIIGLGVVVILAITGVIVAALTGKLTDDPAKYRSDR